MAARVPIWQTPAELTLLGAIWGASFLFMRIGAADFGPFPLVEVRLTMGALVLLPFLWRERVRFTAPLRWRPAGIGAICNAMTVMFTALIAFIFYRERITARQTIGLLVGFVGVVVLASGKTAGGSVWSAALAATCAALFYGVGINLIRRNLSGVPASAVAAATLLGASLAMAPFAIWAWPEHPIPVRSWASAILLGVACTGFAFVLYYRLINRIGGARAATVTYLIPLFAVLWAWLVLAEPLTASMAISAALILGGVALSQQQRRPKDSVAPAVSNSPRA